jgi:hypothetical protein
MIAHFSLPAREPEPVAGVFARIIDGVVMPFPVVPGAWVAIAKDGSGLGVEVLPEASAHNGAAQQASGFHVAITSRLSADEIVDLGRSRGWRAVRCDRGGVFDLVELWIDNRFLVEVLPPEGAARYHAFYTPEVAGRMFGAAL